MFRASGSFRYRARHRAGANLNKSLCAKMMIGFILITIFATASTDSSAAPPASKVLWGTAMEVRGLLAHNLLFGSDLFSVSCASAGNCSAGGNYALSSKHSQAFVVDET